ncbi:MAG TPA: hypothetical protein VHD36_16920 [Pirellulales bacterium]|nr:hypothetical protein [Pirellulales bacterium]
MTLLAQARVSLQTAQAPFRLEIEEAGQTLTCDFAALDSLACAVTSFELSTPALAGQTPQELKRLGEKLSSRLTYLLEPINPIEFDAEQCVVQLRSNPPERDEDRTSYYELVVKRGGSLSLCRFVKKPGSVRETVPMHLTREVFFRLVSDFSAAVA